jgi:transcriptional regulator of acetoin/glycerol metabolism
MDPAEVESYARAAASLAGLEIEDQWWPGVVRHLAGLLSHAAAVADDGPADPAGVFRP